MPINSKTPQLLPPCQGVAKVASLVLSTAGLHLSVLVVRSKVRKAASSVKSKKTAEAKGEAVRGAEEAQEQLEKKAKSPGGPARRGLVPELVADWPP